MAVVSGEMADHHRDDITIAVIASAGRKRRTARIVPANGLTGEIILLLLQQQYGQYAIRDRYPHNGRFGSCRG